MSDTCLPLFVYGTLCPGERNHQLLEEHLEHQVAATCRGRLFLCLDHAYPFPVLIEAQGRVHGTLLYVRPECYTEALALLDRLEEYDAASDDGEYLRRLRTACDATGRQISCWVYLWNRPVPPGPLLPGGDFRAWRKAQGTT